MDKTIKRDKFTDKECLDVMRTLGIKEVDISPNEFYMGMQVELEHGTRYPECNVTNDDPIMTGKIAWAHLKELPDYYTRLKKMEEEGKALKNQSNKQSIKEWLENIMGV